MTKILHPYIHKRSMLCARTTTTTSSMLILLLTLTIIGCRAATTINTINTNPAINTHPSSPIKDQSLSTQLLTRPMPMHRHFILHQSHIRDNNQPHSINVLVNNSSPSSQTIQRQLNNQNNNQAKSDINTSEENYYDSVYGAAADYMKVNKNKKDPLSYPWWVRFHEGKKGVDEIPKTRRAHHCVIYSMDIVDTVDTGDSGVDDGGDDQDGTDSESNADETNGENDPSQQPPPSPPNTTSNNIIPVNTTNSSSTTTNQTIPTHNNTRNLNKKKSTPHKPKTQEYMIMSGGFTDFDWHTFPVWAYDINSAVTGSQQGKWYPVLSITSKPPSSSSSSDHENETNHHTNDGNKIFYEEGNSQRRYICNNDNDQLLHHDDDDLWTTSLLCPPSSRVGHLSLMRGEYLYVFGGLLYNDKEGVFYMEDEPYMYRLYIPNDYFQDPTKYTSQERNNSTSKLMSSEDTTKALVWERILPRIIASPTYMNTDNGHTGESMVNRGEVRGGYWEEEDKWIIYGGLHVRDYETSFGKEQQADETLGDVWSYDFKTDTWEMMAPPWSITTTEHMSVYGDRYKEHPGKRTSFGATVVGDELIVYGGLRKVETYFFDGSTVWDQLDDVWVFNLRTLEWKERVMKESMGRAYHSIVGWKSTEKDGGTVMGTFGGYRIQTDPVDNEEIQYVYDDTMISHPPKKNSLNETMSSIWFLATYEGIQTTISTRLEHSAVLSKEFGNLIVWGGRYRGTSEVEGLWSLNINGDESNVLYMIRNDDDQNENIGIAYIVLVTVMLMSMMFTYMCGIVHRHIESSENGGNLTMEQVMDPNNGLSFARRNGLRQDVIDTLPVRLYEPGLEKEPSRNTTTVTTTSEHDHTHGEDVDENCCPICLVEYIEGDELIRLPCGHEFHKSCADSWLANNASCPSCRHSLQDLTNLSTTSLGQNGEGNQGGTSSASRGRVMSSIVLRTLVSRIRASAASRRTQNTTPVPTPIVSAASTESNSSIPNIRSNSSNDDSTGGDLELELSYTSSIEEIDDNLPPERRGRRRNNNRRFRPIADDEDGEEPVHGTRSRRIRVSNSERRRTRRLAGRRSRGARSPLNDPLQPSSGSLV